MLRRFNNCYHILLKNEYLFNNKIYYKYITIARNKNDAKEIANSLSEQLNSKTKNLTNWVKNNSIIYVSNKYFKKYFKSED